MVALSDGTVRYARVCGVWADRFKFRIGRLPLSDYAEGGQQGEYSFEAEGMYWARGWEDDTISELRATCNLMGL